MNDLMDQFHKKGFVVVKATDLASLIQLRSEIFRKCQELFQHQGKDLEIFFNQFHKLHFGGEILNQKRIELIRYVSANVDAPGLVYSAFRSSILELLGPDLLVQKTTNLMIHQPQDPNRSESHRDAPNNSLFELTLWLPLVNTYGTKAMYVLDREKTQAALQHLEQNSGADWTLFEEHTSTKGASIDVPFGSALFFWPGLIHGSKINVEDETRWTMNLRFKNLFSPNGNKEPFEFFKVFRMSPLTEIAMDAHRKEYRL